MKKLFLICALIILSFSLFGCSGTVNKTTNKVKNRELTLDEALQKVIKHHNSTVKDSKEIDFPPTMKNGETITKKIIIGGPIGNTVKLDLSLKAKKQGSKYIVILTKDYNMIVNGKKAISYWKYEVANNDVKLLDKCEDGHLINLIK